jgi:serine phosphatase RsbU (regulator of sigma subunit)
VLLVGDVVGKGVHAARRAVFVRTSLVTFAPLEDDPARLLRLANAALIDRAGTSLYTDGILDARDDAAERFRDDRLRSLVASHGRESATALVEHLRAALAAYAPVGGDDVCLLAARHRTRVGSEADR